MAKASTESGAPVFPAFPEIELALIGESPLNPRKHFRQAKLDELIASVREKGVIEPLILRPVGGSLHIVAGARRYRAAKAVGLTTVPAVVRDLTDIQALELMAVENGQRDDVHPLDEAEGYQQLLKAEKAYTPEILAAKVSKDVSTIHKRLKLLKLTGAIKKAFLEGEIELGHAESLSRLKPEEQTVGFEECFDEVFDYDHEEQVVKQLVSKRRLDDWIQRTIRLPLDAKSTATEAFPELRDAIAESTVAGAPKLLEVVDSSYCVDKGKAAPLTTEHWKAATANPCEHAQRAVIVIGRGKGRVLQVCTNRDCAIHWPNPSRGTASPSTRTKRSKKAIEADRKQAELAPQARENQQRWESAREEALRVLKKKAIKPGPAVLAVLRLSLFSAKSWTDVVIQCVNHDLFLHGPKDFKNAVGLLKPFGVDLAAIDKALQAKADEKKPAAKKRTAA